MAEKYKFIDLFAGIGGFHLGMSNAGFEFVLASEFEPSARSTYLENFKQEIDIANERYNQDSFVGDITKVDIESIPDFDVLCGGFPCQPFSQAGLQKGFSDKRGNLFFSIKNILEIKQPSAFFLENVRGLLTHDNGNTFKKIVSIITEELGYSFFYKIIKGTDFNCPQHRPRVYMVGFRDPDIKFNFPDPIPLKTSMDDIFGGKCNKKIGYTLRVGGKRSGLNDRRNWDAYLVNDKIRYISSKEGLLMNGFPSDFLFPVSESQAMKQLGNSVIVPAIQAVATEIAKSLKDASNE